MIVLLGEAGVGKSRLAEELAGMARCEHGATVLEGRCVPYGEANAWWPLAEALRQACAITPSDTAEVAGERCQAAVADAVGLAVDSAEVERVVDGLLHVIGQEDASRRRRSGTSRRRGPPRRDRSSSKRWPGNQPLVLAMSELHWADNGVLDALDRLLDTMGSLPFLLVATARPGLERAWRPRPGRHNSVLLTLDPLDEDAADRLLASLLEHVPTADVRSILLERSGGNPLFLEELASLLGETGLVGTDRPGGRPAAELPATLRGLVAARLDTLSPDERAVIEDAAVVGRTGTDRRARRARRRRPSATIPPTRCMAWSSGICCWSTDGEFAFRSDLLREVAYETLTKAAAGPPALGAGQLVVRAHAAAQP